MALKPVCLLSQDEEIGERERGRGAKINTGEKKADGRRGGRKYGLET